MTKTTPTAAILVIGNEILSGSTQDANIAHIGKRLSDRGIKLAEVRIVRDEEAAIVNNLNALRSTYTYVFTTGGIGPTHDDITVDCVAKAFGVKLEIHEETRKLMEADYKTRSVEMNEARLRMARIPVGGKPIASPASIAPGIHIGNVFVMAGIPKVMQSQFETVETLIEGGPPVLSRKVQCNRKEGEIAIALENIQKQYPDIDIGSYPHWGQTPSLSLILRGTNDDELKEATQKVADMVRLYGEEPILTETKPEVKVQPPKDFKVS